MDISDLRAAVRFRTAEPLPGSYGSASVALRDVSTAGAQIEHTQPLRLGSKARLWFRRGDVAVSIQAEMVWSHLSKTPNEQGKYLYRSGLRVQNQDHDFGRALQVLLDRGLISPDMESLDRKRVKLKEKEAEKAGRPTVRMIRPEVNIPSDQQLLIEHARRQLLENPEEAQRWYQRAKYAITHGSVNVASDAIRNREDVLAVWEYLDRSIPISTIVLVFERMRVTPTN
jgi:hypothetical protein